jgi:hypothetical protein
MPNHVTNVIQMQGITDLPLFTEKEEPDFEPAKGWFQKRIMCFDFNKLIPMPEELSVTSGSMVADYMVYYLTDRCTVPIGCIDNAYKQILDNCPRIPDKECYRNEVFLRVMKDAHDNPTKAKTMYEQGKIYAENFKKYGAASWYDWCTLNWGTKWNSYSNRVRDADTIQFDTAWKASIPAIRKLSEMYPTIPIKHWYADEDMGVNSGYVEYINGEANIHEYKKLSNKAYANYIFCKGESPCLAKDANGNWYRKDCEDCDGCD